MVFFYLKNVIWCYSFSYDFSIKDDLKKPDPEITQVELKLFVDELKKKKVLSNMLFVMNQPAESSFLHS